MEGSSGAYHSIDVTPTGNTIILSLTLKPHRTAIYNEWKEKETILRSTFACMV